MVAITLIGIGIATVALIIHVIRGQVDTDTEERTPQVSPHVRGLFDGIKLKRWKLAWFMGWSVALRLLISVTAVFLDKSEKAV